LTRIPIVECYKGVGIHDQQTRDRIERVVRWEIDRVLVMNDVRELVEFAADRGNSPEARMLAASKVEAIYQLAAEERRQRPDIDLDDVRASVAGLDSAAWRSPWGYGTLADHDAVRREVPLSDEACQSGRKKLRSKLDHLNRQCLQEAFLSPK